MKSIICVPLTLLWFGSFSIAAEPAPSPSPSPMQNFLEKSRDNIKQTSADVNKKVGMTKDYRENASGYFFADYSPIDLIIPSKYGATLGLVQNVKNTLELEYLRGTISIPFFIDDLGKFKDERLSLIRRSYFGSNSFNMSYGISYFKMGIRIGSDLLGRISGPIPAGIDLFQAEAVGINFGIGNRWSINKNFLFGIDWISLAQPIIVTDKKTDYLAYASDANDRDDMDTARKVMSYFPRFVLFKLQIGILF